VSVLLIVAHPDRSSLNHGVFERIATVLAEEQVVVYGHDLYEERYSPVLEHEEIRRRFSFDDSFITCTRELREVQGIVLIYPDWWGMPPAILKGWIDRIFRPGIVFDYEGDEFAPKERVPLLAGKRVLICTTTDEINPSRQTPIQTIWRERVFAPTGIDEVHFSTLYNVRESTGRQRRVWIEEIEATVRRLFSEF